MYSITTVLNRPSPITVVRKISHLPRHLQLRDYQDEAIAAWFANACHGILEMATGTGKTITALSAMV